MAVTLFSGIPRSGKTYKMVAEAMKLKDKYFIIHNIVGFKNEVLEGFGFKWTDYLTKNNLDADVFFSKDYQSELSEKIREKYNRPILMIIDEAAEWFDVHKRPVKLWLNYHGHLNQQIYLVIHNVGNLPRAYRAVIECEYRAKSNIFLFLPWWFFYNRLLGGVGAGYIFERIDQKIFALYKSSDIKENRRKKSWYLPFLIAFVVAGFIVFVLSPAFIFHRPKPEKKISPVSDLKINSDNQKEDNIKKLAAAAVIAESAFDKLYAYVGNFNGDVIVENRKTGSQYPLSRIEGGFKVVRFDRANNCLLFGIEKKFFTLYNFNRYINIEAAPASSSEQREQLSPMFGVRGTRPPDIGLASQP